MTDQTQPWGKNLLSALLLVSAVAGAGALALGTSAGQAAYLLLLAPVIHASLKSGRRWWAVVVLLTVAACLGIELLRLWQPNRQVNLSGVVAGAATPLAAVIVAAIGLALHRRDRASLLQRINCLQSAEGASRLAAELVHDFRNVLTIISGTVQALARNTSLDSRAAKDVCNVVIAAQQGNDLVNQIAGLSQPSTPHRVACDLNRCLDEDLRLIERILPANITLLRRGEQPLPVRADCSQIGRAVLNLCLNARDAMPYGGRLTVATERRQIGAREFAVVTIADTGEGIDPAIMKHIFEPPWTAKSAPGRYGLGLGIVRAAAQAHDGWVEVRNDPGKGVSFVMCLPLDADTSASQSLAVATW